MKKTFKVIGWILGGLVAFVVVVVLLINLIAPGYIRDYINDNSEELAGQKVYVNDLSLNLFTLTVDADSIVVYMPESETVFLTVDHLNLDLDWLPLFSSQVELDVAVRVLEGGKLDGHVGYGIENEDFDVKFALNRFNLNVVLPYLQQSMTATDMQGLLDASMHVKGNVNRILALEVQGQSCVSNFLLADNSGASCFAADSLSLATSEVNLLKNRYGFSYILLKNPDIHAEMGKDSLDNFTRMLIDAPIDQEEPADSLTTDSVMVDSTMMIGEEPLQLYIDRLVVSNGKLGYVDSTLTYDPFVYQVDSINFEAENFDLSGINDLAISCMPGSGDGSIAVKYHGCFDDLHNMTVTLNVKNVALKDFSPYVVQMFGNPMTGGTLSFDTDTKVEQGNLDSQNHLVINNPVVEDKRKDVKPEMKGVPLKAGIYILTDKNGVCDMELPVTGNIDEPKFSVKKLIFKTLGKLIVKVATSPFGGSNGASTEAVTAEAKNAATAVTKTAGEATEGAVDRSVFNKEKDILPISSDSTKVAPAPEPVPSDSTAVNPPIQ